MGETWVLVADSSEARIYAAGHRKAPLTLVESLSHPESRTHPRDRLTDVPGRVHDRFGPARHSLDHGEQIRDEDRLRFAREIAATLGTAHRQNRFERLVVMAGPALLGVLREAFDKSLTEIIAAEIPKDLVDQDEAVIRSHLP